MAETKEKVATTWLQCQLPKSDWEALNKRRLALNLKWADIIVPATREYIDTLEAGQVTQAEPASQETAAEKPKAKKSKRAKKTEVEQPAAEIKPKANNAK